MEPVSVYKYLKESSIEDLKKDLQKAADDHFYHNMDDHWGHEGFQREDTLYSRIQNIIKDLEDKGVKVYHKEFDGTEKPGYQMGYEIVFKDEKVNEEDERVSEIDLHRKEIDGDYDTNFADKLEDLGYEYIFKYDGKVYYRRDPQKYDDDIIIIDYEHGSMIKVDHNGESLFFDPNETKLLNRD